MGTGKPENFQENQRRQSVGKGPGSQGVTKTSRHQLAFMLLVLPGAKCILCIQATLYWDLGDAVCGSTGHPVPF